MPFSGHHHLVLFLFLALYAGKSDAGGRRTLHEPFLPADSGKPTPAPSQSPPEPQPKIPFTNDTPFFPVDPATSQSPPSPTRPVTFPANISGLIRPHPSPEKKSGNGSAKVIIAVVVTLFCLGLILALGLFFFRRFRDSDWCSQKGSAGSGSVRLFSASSLANKVGVSTSSDVLYLGTLVDSRRVDDSPAGISPYQKLGSPEDFHHRRSPQLHPLPPLSRQQLRADSGNAGSEEDEEEEFYSPRGSSSGNNQESPSGSCRKISPPSPAKCQSGGSSNLSTPSYPSSNSTSATPSPSNSPSPIRFTSESPKCKPQIFQSSDIAGISKFRPLPPPPPPPPPPRPLTPSPPKRKPPSPSSSSSPSKNSGLSHRSPARIAEFSGHPPVTSKPVSAPPPPPPPPPSNFWENQVRPPPLLPIARPPPLVTLSRTVELKTPVISPAKLPENPDSIEKSEETPRPKLKPLHWDKVRASSDRATVWDQLKSSSFQLNEEMIETLFVCNAGSSAQKEVNRRQVLPSLNHENRVLDPKKSQNIAILLRALNVTKEEVCEALLEGNTDALGAELLETLVKMAPTKEEELRLKEHKDDSPLKLGPAERFLKAVLDIPFAFKRVDALLYIANFDSEIKYLRKSFQTLEAGCEELRDSRLFMKLLEAVLKTGNRMNVGTNRGDAHAFKLDTLLKLVDIKGTDGKTTLLHFVVQEIIRTEGSRLSGNQIPAKKPHSQVANPASDDDFRKLGLQVVAGLGNELDNVKKAAAMDSDVLSSYVYKLAGGIEMIAEVLRLIDGTGSPESSRKFSQAMNGFLRKAEEEIVRIQAEESVALSLVKEITEYFHGNTAKEEAHPFRIFMIVRDFLSVLGQVCKEVGKIQETATVSGSIRQFPVPANPVLLPVFPRFNVQRLESSSDEDSSLSS